MLSEARAEIDEEQVLWPDDDELGELGDAVAAADSVEGELLLDAELLDDDSDEAALVDEEDVELDRLVRERLARRDSQDRERLEVEVEVDADTDELPRLLAELPVFVPTDADVAAETIVEPVIDQQSGLEAPLAITDPIRAPFWGSINAMIYALLRGLRGMAQSPLVQLIAIGTMAVCMLLLGTTTLLFLNARSVVAGWGIDVPVTVYMQPGTDAGTTEALRDKLAELPEVEHAQRVTPEQALARLDEGVGEHADLLAGIDPAALPDSIEVQLIAGVEPGFADALASRVQGMSGVDEVAVLGPWVQQAEAALTTLRWLAVGVGALVSLACLAIVWSTIRLGVFARRAELDILRLVGGTSRFVRAPFLVEGVLQGALGTALALAGLWLAFDLVRPFLEQGLALVFAAGSIRFFAPVELGVALAFGAALGLLGSRAAVARYAEA